MRLQVGLKISGISIAVAALLIGFQNCSKNSNPKPDDSKLSTNSVSNSNVGSSPSNSMDPASVAQCFRLSAPAVAGGENSAAINLGDSTGNLVAIAADAIDANGNAAALSDAKLIIPNGDSVSEFLALQIDRSAGRAEFQIPASLAEAGGVQIVFSGQGWSVMVAPCP